MEKMWVRNQVLWEETKSIKMDKYTDNYEGLLNNLQAHPWIFKTKKLTM
jgi:hypothetical protein